MWGKGTVMFPSSGKLETYLCMRLLNDSSVRPYICPNSNNNKYINKYNNIIIINIILYFIILIGYDRLPLWSGKI
jgi:hypothetical protein